MNAPNLDSLDRNDLMTFWYTHQNGREYRALFRDGGKGTRRATADLANYAANKATAMRCRETGDIPGALMYEGIADRIYTKLPPFARW